MQAAQAALPPCYSRELDNCLNRDNRDGLPPEQCQTIMAAYDVDWDAADQAVVSLPYCSSKRADVGMLAVAGGAGVLVGVLLAAVFRRK